MVAVLIPALMVSLPYYYIEINNKMKHVKSVVKKKNTLNVNISHSRVSFELTILGVRRPTAIRQEKSWFWPVGRWPFFLT